MSGLTYDLEFDPVAAPTPPSGPRETLDQYRRSTEPQTGWYNSCYSCGLDLRNASEKQCVRQVNEYERVQVLMDGSRKISFHTYLISFCFDCFAHRLKPL